MKRVQHKGFTLVELSLATAFVAILLLVIAYLILNISTIYQKGMAIKSINSAGRQIVDDLNRSIIASSARDIGFGCSSLPSSLQASCNSDGGFLLTYQQYYKDNIRIDGDSTNSSKALPTYGAFCTGRYSYLWNTGYTFSNRYTLAGTSNQPEKARLKWRNTGNTDQDYVKDFRLLRFLDYQGALCSNHMDTAAYQPKNSPEFDVTSLGMASAPADLLAGSDDDLAIYDLVIFRPVTHNLTFQAFYSGTFILATVPGGVDITGSGEFCKDPPDDLSTDFAYCSINKFNFAARARGELTSEEATYQKKNK